MKPYIGILIDSLWEAVGNKVLWALLIGWSLILAGLAPFGYVSERSYQLSSTDIDNRSQLIEKLAKAADGKGPLAAKVIAKEVDPKFLDKIKEAASEENSRRIRSSDLAKELNAAVTARGLYSEEAFPTAKRRKRLQPLIESEPDDLSDADVEELNRELIQLAFPLELNRPRGEQLWIGYAGFKLGDPLPVNRRQIRQFLEPMFLQLIIKLGLAVVAVFVAIIVTSPMIPDTFRSGSLHLMLSKPISRIWLYLSKFFGGTIFVLVNISFVLLGLYLIAGFRFDIWNAGLLACIPLLLFVFIIFYSVSGFTGLVWGNAIVCVVSCLIFWLFCFSLGFIHDAIMPHVEFFPQISRIEKIDDKLTVVNERGDFSVWNEEYSVWQPAIRSNNGGQVRTMGPIYDAERKQVMVKSFFRDPFGGLRARSQKIALIDIGKSEENNETSASEASLGEAESGDTSPADDEDADNTSEEGDATEKGEESGDETAEADAETSDEENNGASAEDDEDDPKRENDEEITSAKQARETPLWLSDEGPELPNQVRELLELGDDVVAVARSGLYRLDKEQMELAGASEKALFGFKLPSWATKSAFQNVAPKDYFLSDNSTASPTQDGKGLIIYSSGNVDHLVLRENKFEIVASGKLEGDGTEAALVQMNANFCVVARDELPIQILSTSLEPLQTVELDKDQEIKRMAWIPGGDKLAIITHRGEILELDCTTAKLAPLDLPISGDFTSMNWVDETRLYVGVQPNRVYLLNLAEDRVEQKFEPTASTFERVYGWGIKPVYNITPKPAALDNSMTYLLTGSDTQAMNIITNDLEAAQLKLDVWKPILTNLAFVAFLLTVSCIYVARKEF